MDHNKKADALAHWRLMLDTKHDWNSPGVNYRFLVDMADGLLSAQMIDPLERFDLVELAQAAFSYYVEDGNREWRHPASDYAVYDQNAERIGSLLNNRLSLHAPDADPYFCDYDAFLKPDNSIITRTYQLYGTLDERHIYRPGGERLTLVEFSRRIEGINYPRLDDPDRYRSLIDAAVVMLEQGDFAAYVKLWERHSYSIFKKCSHCWDLFQLREDCAACSGRGFVEDGQCPNKLPRWLAERVDARETQKHLPALSTPDENDAKESARRRCG